MQPQRFKIQRFLYTGKIDPTRVTIVNNTVGGVLQCGHGISCDAFHSDLIMFKGCILSHNGNPNNANHGIYIPNNATTRTVCYSSLVQGLTTTQSACIPGMTDPIFKNFEMETTVLELPALV